MSCSLGLYFYNPSNIMIRVEVSTENYLEKMVVYETKWSSNNICSIASLPASTNIISYSSSPLTPAIWRRWVQMNELHCIRSFFKSIAPLSRTQAKFSFILSIQRSLGLPLFPFPSNLACSSMFGILPITTNHRSLRLITFNCLATQCLSNIIELWFM